MQNYTKNGRIDTFDKSDRGHLISNVAVAAVHKPLLKVPGHGFTGDGHLS